MAACRQYLVVLFFIASINLFVVPPCARGKSYEPSTVKGMDAFNGSASAREILGKNGFVVADPAFKQIFEGYINSPETGKPSESAPRGTSVPLFITTVSAWHTYHVLLEEGVKEMEEVQSRRLLNFSRHFLATVANQNPGPAGSGLSLLASVGLALQEENYPKSAGPGAKHLVDGLCTGSTPVEMVLYARPDQREAMMTRVREWSKSAH